MRPGMGGAFGSKSLLNLVVGGGHAQSYLDIRSGSEDVQVADHQRRASLHDQRPAVPDDDLYALPGQPVLRLYRLVGVAYSAHPDRARRLLAYLDRQHVRGVDLHVHELTPWLLVARKPLHEARVAVAARVLTPGVGVDGVVVYLGGRQDRFGLYLFDDHEPPAPSRPVRRGPTSDAATPNTHRTVKMTKLMRMVVST